MSTRTLALAASALASVFAVTPSRAQTTPAPAAPAAASAAVDDLTSYQTADALWTHIQDLVKGPDAHPTTRKEAAVFFGKVVAAADAFGKSYPADPRRWDAKLLHVQMGAFLASVKGEEGPDEAAQTAAYKEIADAPEASVDARGAARFALLQMQFESANDEKPSPALEALVSAFIKDFPQNPHVAELQMMRVKSLQANDPAKAAEMLATLAKDANPDVAADAQGQLRLLNIGKQPLDLKFKAVDGSEVDLSKLRGKVVLVDFWATWCGPCMAEVPDTVAAYKKFHDRGFEVVGISLDQEKDKMLAVNKDKEMVWPEYFDGKGWQNEISRSYGIDSIPRMWLLNKQGVVVNPDAREDLAGAVEKLLAEGGAAPAPAEKAN